jgi:dipeptidyl aminopeptidase/acylaminoacyl peptidase
MLVQGVRYPSIAELARPMLRLAGVRIDPGTNGRHLAPYFIGVTLKRLADGSEVKAMLPAGARISFPAWSPDGKSFVFTNTVSGSIELWVGETKTGKVRKLRTPALNGVIGDAVGWMPDCRTLLVKLIVSGRGGPPVATAAPTGPKVQESYGKAGPVRTYQDMLSDPHDEDLFDYYASAQLALVDLASGKTRSIGPPAVFDEAVPAPDGQRLLIARVRRPYSYLHLYDDFPKEVEVWDLGGKVVYKLASLPLADQVPIEGVPTGPRGYHWRPTDPATLAWVEALDGGDPRNKVPHRDKVLMLKAPFVGAPVEVTKTEQRYSGVQWFEKPGLAFVSDYDRDRRWRRSFLLDVDRPETSAKLVWSHSVNERYGHPGYPLRRTLPTGHSAILQSGDCIYLTGAGATPEGDRPFLDRFDLRTLRSERLFRSDAESLESVVALLAEEGARFLTRRETPTQPPNYFLHGRDSAPQALTNFPDPTPQIRGITKELVKYQRPDGVQLSFTLYLPPGYQKGTRLPTVVWAYPLEYTDPGTAGQVSGSPKRFTTIAGTSHLFFLLAGYAVLDDASMPVVGDPETVNNTYVEQITADAQAAIDKAVELGVTDPKRVGVGGHSYGAFMTANLLAHCDLFRAGIARSGAYNRTLTPFGFQSERRTLWEAPATYVKMSPFMFANQLKEPILLIHGEADNNSGTFPIQSERMYQALRGNGGNVRYVVLPHESHGYSARESVEHTLYEMIAWFDKHVKNAAP